MHTHHDEHYDGGGEPAAAASWFVIMALTLVLVVALLIALFAWAPWNDDNTTSPGREFNPLPTQQQQQNPTGGSGNQSPGQ